jgi:hypothetical protein
VEIFSHCAIATISQFKDLKLIFKFILKVQWGRNELGPEMWNRLLTAVFFWKCARAQWCLCISAKPSARVGARRA